MSTERFEFKCPDCEHNTLEEVTKALAYTTIGCFYRGYPQYDDTDTEHLEVIRTQCYNCGVVVYEGSCNDIVQHCIDKGWIEGMEPALDWEV